MLKKNPCNPPPPLIVKNVDIAPSQFTIVLEGKCKIVTAEPQVSYWD